MTDPSPPRLSTVGAAIASASRGKHVLYSAGLYTRSALAARLHSIPLVVKLAGDPAFERARARGLFAGSLGDFQSSQRGATIRYLKWQRNTTMLTAFRVVIPSRYLAEMTLAWGLAPERVNVIPNPGPDVDCSEPREGYAGGSGSTGRRSSSPGGLWQPRTSRW